MSKRLNRSLIIKKGGFKMLFSGIIGDFCTTWLECMYCSHKGQADILLERKFRCPRCNGLYDIKHNFSDLCKVNSVRKLKKLFEKRTKKFSTACTKSQEISGVWRYKELIMPYLPEKYIVTLGEGNVPIIRAGKKLLEWIGGNIDLWLILEGMTPTGSFKDFGGTVMMSVAKAAGIKTVACASTGDTSAMAAAYAAAAGINCLVILPKGKITPVQLAQPLVHGAKVITLPGSFDDCMRVMQELVKNYGVYPANSLNPARIEGHQATVFQIAQFFNWKMPDWIALPVGNGSNCSSIGKGMRLLNQLEFIEKNKSSKILGCQSQAANPLTRSWLKASALEHSYSDNFIPTWKKLFKPIKVKETSATAVRIGNPVSRDKVMREIFGSNGAMETASERNLNEAVAICGKDGVFVCPQTGIALAGVRNAVKEGRIDDGESVVVVSTATGLKFTESASKNLMKEIVEAKTCDIKEVARILKI
jgi:threonine synthase